MFGLSKAIYLRLQGVSIDTPMFNDMGGSQGGTTQTVQKADPWEGVQPYLRDMFGRAQAQSQTGVSPNTTLAQNMMTQRALTGSPLNAAAQGQNMQTLGGDYLSANSNPYLKGAVDQALQGVQSRVNSQFQGDNFGNSAHQEWLAKSMANTALPIYAQNYQQERQRQFGAQALSPTLANQDYMDPSQLGAVGQQQQDFPWQQLQRYQQAISGAGGSNTQSTNPYFTNPLASAMGLGLGGMGIYNMGQNAGLWGGAGMGGLGAGMGLDMGAGGFFGGAGAGELGTSLAEIAPMFMMA